MWKQYRKTIIPTQVMIVTICLLGYFYAKQPIISLLFYFAIMQVFAVLGTMWAMRLKRKMESGKRKRDGVSDLLA